MHPTVNFRGRFIGVLFELDYMKIKNASLKVMIVLFTSISLCIIGKIDIGNFCKTGVNTQFSKYGFSTLTRSRLL